MDELQTIREALKAFDDENFHNGNDCTLSSAALGAMERLEARAAEMPDASGLVRRIRGNIENVALTHSESAAEIGQYAYRYSEDIRKDRDYWKKIAMAFHDAVHQHLDNHKMDVFGPESEVSKLSRKVFSQCEAQGIDCAEACLKPRNHAHWVPIIRSWSKDACPNCGAYPLRMNAVPRNGSFSMGASDMIAVCQSCKKPMPEGWHLQ